MKILISLIFISLCQRSLLAQDQTINGNLQLGTDTGSVTGIGKILSFKGVQANTDDVLMYRFNRLNGQTDLRCSIGDDFGTMEDRFVVGANNWVNGTFNPLFVVRSDGKIGIGTETFTEEILAINGSVRTKEVKVEVVNWPDYVFKKSYKLLTLQETQNFIKENGHLPDMPSAVDIEMNGQNLGEMNAKLVKKIEELTLHLIEKDRQLRIEKSRNDLQQRQITKIISKVSKLERNH